MMRTRPNQSFMKKEKSYTGTRDADILANYFAKENTIKMNRNRKQKRDRRQKLWSGTHSHAQNQVNSPFLIKELDHGIRHLKKKKAPGPNKITNEMLQHLGPYEKTRILNLFNELLIQGILPEEMGRSWIIPVPKKGKPKCNKTSYLPNSLTSCLGKIMERMINNRLMKYPEDNKLLDNCQSGFRKHQSTNNQTT